jgi:hypothetical protein
MSIFVFLSAAKDQVVRRDMARGKPFTPVRSTLITNPFVLSLSKHPCPCLHVSINH